MNTATIDRFIFDSTITLGPGAAVNRVITAFESNLLILSNLPGDVTDMEVKQLAEPFGHVTRVLLEKPAARVEFAKCADAALAVRMLDKTEYRSMTLSATLYPRGATQREKVADKPNRTIKISWPAPSLTGWARYSSITTAKEQAKRLQGLTVGGRKITVTYISPLKNQTHSFAVELKNLPSNTTREDLKSVCPGTSSVEIALRTNYDRDTSIQGVRRLLAPYEPIDSFYVLPSDASKLRIIAFAETQIASTITTALHRTKQTFLKNNALLAEQVYSMKYHLTPSQFLILKEDLDHLRDIHQDHCKIRYLDKDDLGRPAEIVSIHVDSVDPFRVGRVRKALDEILCGEALVFDGNVSWDDLFDTPDSRTFFTSLNADTRFFVEPSRRDRTLRYFSRQVPLDDAKELVVRQLRLVRARRHHVSVARDAIRLLLSGCMTKLRDEDGISMTLNIVSRTLTIQSEDQNDIKKVKRVLAKLESSPASMAVHGVGVETLCSICTSSVAEPIKLPCGHIYCRNCMRHILQNSTGTNYPLMCMVDRVDDHFETTLPCYTEFPLDVILGLLSKREQNRLFDLSVLSYVRQHLDEFQFCPTPDCQIFYRPDKPGTALRCPSCQKWICPACCVQFHEGLSCAEYREA